MIRIPGYTLQRKLGVGGMATVFLAVQESLQREVALKVMSQALAADRTFAKRFVGEARTIAELNHPNIVSIHDVGVTEQHLHYFAMQYLPGGDLDDKIKDRLPERELLRILLPMCSALGHAHERGFVHRDVTPGNIMFDSSDQPVLTDFGIATVVSEATRMTATGLSLGTSYYMSPEQARGRNVDARSDIYSLGGVIFEALTGTPPYEGDDSFAVAYAHVYEPVPRLPPRFLRWEEVIARCMAKAPDERYESMDELATVLQGFMDRTTGKGRRAETEATLADATVELAIPPQLAPPSTSGRYRWIGLALGDRPSQWLSGLRPAVSRGAAWAAGRVVRSRPLRWGAAGVVVAGLLAWAIVQWWPQAAPVPPPALVVTEPDLNTGQAAPDAEPAPAEPEPEPITTVPSERPQIPALVDLDADSDATIAPLDASLTEQGRQRLFTLLAEASAALDEDRLTTPPDDNAFDLFQSALSLDNDNAQALNGLRRIVSRYVTLARAQIQRGQYRRSLALAERAQRVARQIDLDTATGKELDELGDFGYQLAMSKGNTAYADGNPDAARVHYQGAAQFRPDDPAIAQALLNLDTPPAPAGPQRIVETLASGGEGPGMIVFQEQGLAVSEAEITVAQYRQFVTATGLKWEDEPCRNLESWLRASRKLNWQAPGFAQSDRHPVVCVNWDEAYLYAQWLSRETGQTYRLPSVREWLQFAGPMVAGCNGNFADEALAGEMRRKTLDCNDGHAWTAPAGSLPTLPNGLTGVHGNVREWTSDCLRLRNDRCRQVAAAGQSWMDGDRDKFDEFSKGFDPVQRFNTVGIRLVREL